MRGCCRYPCLQSAHHGFQQQGGGWESHNSELMCTCFAIFLFFGQGARTPRGRVCPWHSDAVACFQAFQVHHPDTSFCTTNILPQLVFRLSPEALCVWPAPHCIQLGAFSSVSRWRFVKQVARAAIVHCTAAASESLQIFLLLKSTDRYFLRRHECGCFCGRPC